MSVRHFKVLEHEDSTRRKQLCRFCFSESVLYLNVYETIVGGGLTLAGMFTKILGIHMLPDGDHAQFVCCDCLEEVIELENVNRCTKRTLEHLIWRENSLMACAKKVKSLENASRLPGSGSESVDKQLPNGRVSDNEYTLRWTNMDIQLERYHCETCGRVFRSQQKLTQHVESCLEPCLHHCRECREVFPNSDELNRHKYLFHSLSKHHPCGRCLKKFSSRKKLVKHIQKYDFKCKPKDLSDLRTDNSETVVTGQSDKSHSIHPVISPESKTRVVNSTGEKGAELSNDEQGPDVTTRQDLETHAADVNCHKCATCDEVCKSKKNLVLHVKEAHDSEKAFICKVCKSGFTSRLSLGVHQHSHDKRFACYVCGRKYLTKSCFKLHAVTCQDGRVLHKCKVCGKEIYSRTNLNVHMFQHSTGKSFACIQCPKRYKLKCDLRRHVRVVHLKLKPHKCGICQKMFSTRTEINFHYSAHSEDRPYKCSFCEKCFKIKPSVRKHEKKMHF